MSTPTSPVPALPSVQTLLGQTMGTRWTAKLVAEPQADLHRLHDGIQALLDRVVAQMSSWEADSVLSRYNRSAAGTWFELPAEFAEVMRCALQVAALTNGAYDPSIGPVVDLWGFGPAGPVHAAPPPGQQRDAHARVGWRRLSMAESPARLLQPGDVALDLSAIAKGYGADLALAYLRAQGITAALVEVGGELSGYGRKPDGRPWQVLIQADPDEAYDDAQPPPILDLDQRAIATSGDYWHRFEDEGQSYSHTLDPRTGRPVLQAPCAVTVVAADAMHADAWATAMTVLGQDAGLQLAESLDLAVRFATRGTTATTVAMSSAFARLLPG